MKIEGANLGKKEVEYRPLSEYQLFTDEGQEILKKLEQLYLKFQAESKQTEVKPFPQKGGKVEISQGMVNHKCSNSIDSLRTLSQYGILASEWFGEIESEKEGVFCAFVDRIHSEEYDKINGNRAKLNRAKLLNAQRLRSFGDDVILFFDTTNPIMEQLLHLDYFEYEKVKQQNPEKLTKIYSKDEIELFDSIIEPFSLNGKDHHTKDILPYCDWSAIPGGIPSQLVNGICTKRQNYDKEYIDEVSKLFPNATIFNGELEILHTSKREKDTQKLGEETLEERKDIVLLDEIEQAQENQVEKIDKQKEGK